ncbi:MAG: hypothetical protein ACFFDW_14045 [Candidatus Thorarchaeota archaeon]
MGKLTIFVEKKPKTAIGIWLLTLIIFSIGSGLISYGVIKNQKNMVLDINLCDVHDLTQLFDGFNLKIYNVTDGQSIVMHYGFDFEDDFPSIYTFHSPQTTEFNNSFLTILEIFENYRSSCFIQSIKLVLDTINPIDYSNLHLVLLGDDEQSFYVNNFDSDIEFTFNPLISQITFLFF